MLTLDTTNPDTTPPTIPGNLQATAISDSQINLSWDPATDDVNVAGYRVYRNGTEVGTTPSTNFSNTGLAPSTPYVYTVRAYDAAGNESAHSDSTSDTTQAHSDTTPPGEQILNVPDEYPTIKAAINAASTGEIVRVAPGTYRENLTLSGKTITLTSYFLDQGDESFIAQTVIDGGGSTVIFVDSSVGAETTIQGFTIRNGNNGMDSPF